MKFTYKLLSLGLAIACLSGCNAANTEIASSSAATATVDPATDSTEVPASNNVFTSAGDGLYVTTDSGIYELQTVFPDSANIFYTDANTKERIFSAMAYIPKATVQAAIGSIPLAAGVEAGSIILSVAVLAIILTAPIGATFIDRTYKTFLAKTD